jgi:methenyltetrahydromethanopterin cyclohydrolase
MDHRMTSLEMNERAWAIADECARRSVEMRIDVRTLACGSRVIDAGIAFAGGLAAGCAIAEMCMGGLGHVTLSPVMIGPETWPGVQVWTDHPATACMASQYAGWAISPEGYFAMGSGPLRSAARVERELFDKLRYTEEPSRGVLVLEGRAAPTDLVAGWVASRAKMSPGQLTFVIAPTASLAGGVQVVSRTVETGLHKMDTLGFDVNRVVSAIGMAPLPPVAKNDLRAMGRTNDCVLYGGRAHYTVDATDDELSALADQLPSSSCAAYGSPFLDIFERHDRDFYKIDPMLFSAAEVWLTSTSSGRTFRGGQLHADILRASLYGS